MAEKLRVMPKNRKTLKRKPTKILAGSASPIPGKGLFTRDIRPVSVGSPRGKVAAQKRFEAQKAGAPGPILSAEQKGVIKRMDAQIEGTSSCNRSRSEPGLHSMAALRRKKEKNTSERNPASPVVSQGDIEWPKKKKRRRALSSAQWAVPLAGERKGPLVLRRRQS